MSHIHMYMYGLCTISLFYSYLPKAKLEGYKNKQLHFKCSFLTISTKGNPHNSYPGFSGYASKQVRKILLERNSTQLFIVFLMFHI